MTAIALPTPALDAEAANLTATRWLHIGQRHEANGRHDDAVAAYRLGLAAVEAARDSTVATSTISELHVGLGNTCLVQGNFGLAAASYEAALRIAPGLSSCWCNLGIVHAKIGKSEQAIAYYLQALRMNPSHWPSRTNLVEALMATKQYVIAKALLLELIAERPQDATLCHQLGKTCFELEEMESALDSFDKAVALDPGDSESLYWIGGIKQSLGDLDGARVCYAQAAKIQPLIRRPAIKSPPDFRVLALYAPFGGNTPTAYLFRNADYETDTLALFEQNHHDVDSLKQDVQVVVNLLSDVDQAGAMLPLAADLVQRLDKPTVNDPRRIQRTARDEVAGLLTGIPYCRVPKIVRQHTGTPLSVEDLQTVFPGAASVLARPVGTHGGDDFDKIDSPADLRAYLATPADTDRYFIEYVDYRSTDGHFRKYRFIFVGDEVLPYHLAIGDDWKVHHINTDMANRLWMQQEEAAFLRQPEAVFQPTHFRALHLIRERIGLEYFGIDCGLDASGNLVVFEVNASMLVHDDNAAFAYKDPAVRRIKSAFNTMLARLAATHA